MGSELKSQIKKLLYVLLTLVIIYGIYISLLRPKLQEWKKEGISWIVTEFFEEEILFFSELIPSFCDASGNLSPIFYDNPKSSLSYYATEEKMGNDGVKNLVEITRKAKKQLNNLEPKNDFQKRLKRNLISATSDINFNKLMSKDEDVSVKEYIRLHSEVTLAFWESGAEKHYKDIVSQISENEKELPFSIRLSFGILGSDYSLSDKKHLLKAVNQVAKKNKNYLDEFNGGCLELLNTEIEKAFEEETLREKREKTRLEKIFEGI